MIFPGEIERRGVTRANGIEAKAIHPGESVRKKNDAECPLERDQVFAWSVALSNRRDAEKER